MRAMKQHGGIWLVANEASGSNDDVALAALHAALADAGYDVAGQTSFPAEPVPAMAELREAGIRELAVFAGDGTVGTVVTGLFGWEGAILVLPGGTMNLLSHRLHGDASMEEILASIAVNGARKVRPPVIYSRHGHALTGVLAGPGAAWNEVREAMRHADLIDMVDSAIQAARVSTSGAMVVCEQPACGRPEGYTAITLTPMERGLEVTGYYVETLADQARHGVALLQRDFRNGPHEELGVYPRMRIASPEGEPVGLLMDGESAEGEAREEFVRDYCKVDLLATRDVA